MLRARSQYHTHVMVTGGAKAGEGDLDFLSMSHSGVGVRSCLMRFDGDWVLFPLLLFYPFKMWWMWNRRCAPSHYGNGRWCNSLPCVLSGVRIHGLVWYVNTGFLALGIWRFIEGRTCKVWVHNCLISIPDSLWAHFAVDLNLMAIMVVGKQELKVGLSSRVKYL